MTSDRLRGFVKSDSLNKLKDVIALGYRISLQQPEHLIRTLPELLVLTLVLRLLL